MAASKLIVASLVVLHLQLVNSFPISLQMNNTSLPVTYTGVAPFYTGRYETFYKAVDPNSVKVTLKIAHKNCNDKVINEWRIHKHLGAVRDSKEAETARKAGILIAIDYGTVSSCDFEKQLENRSVIVTESIDKTLSQLDPALPKPTPDAWIKMGYKMITSIAYIRKKYVVHGEINPGNFVFTQEGDILLGGFNCSWLQHEQPSSLDDTNIFSSLRIHLSKAVKKRWLKDENLTESLLKSDDDDDLEGFAIVFYDIYFRVPWEESEEDSDEIMNLTPGMTERYKLDKGMQSLAEALSYVNAIQIQQNFPNAITKHVTEVSDPVAKLLEDIVLYARRKLPYQESSEKNFPNFISSWESLLQ